MIEFKQIIGRGTRLYDGKDYFTILDFVKAHHHFSDPEWDGEPLEPEPVNRRSAGSDEQADQPAEDGDLAAADQQDRPSQAKLRIKLGDGKERSLQHMLVTSFWHPDGKPMSSQQFIELLYGELPAFVRDEAELQRALAEASTPAPGSQPASPVYMWSALALGLVVLGAVTALRARRA